MDANSRYTGKPGQWWNAPPQQIRHAYYRLLREVYEYTAQEALAKLRENEARYPDFMRNPIGTMRAAINADRSEA